MHKNIMKTQFQLIISQYFEYVITKFMASIEISIKYTVQLQITVPVSSRTFQMISIDYCSLL